MLKELHPNPKGRYNIEHITNEKQSNKRYGLCRLRKHPRIAESILP
jgi:hypothetical protein